MIDVLEGMPDKISATGGGVSGSARVGEKEVGLRVPVRLLGGGTQLSGENGGE